MPVVNIIDRRANSNWVEVDVIYESACHHNDTPPEATQFPYPTLEDDVLCDRVFDTTVSKAIAIGETYKADVCLYLYTPGELGCREDEVVGEPLQ